MRVHRSVVPLTVMVLAFASPTLRPLPAQQAVTANAQIRYQVFKRAAGDTSKAVMILEIDGLSPFALRSLQSEDVRLADEAGRTFTPIGVTFRPRPRADDAILAQYTQPESARIAEQRFLFLLPAGSTRFSLRLPSIPPVPVRISVMGTPK